MSSTPFGLVANLANRRATNFLEAVRRAGLPSPLVCGWNEVIRDPTVLDRLRECSLVRLDSAGEDSDVADALLHSGTKALGKPTATLKHGELAHIDAQHAGFSTALALVADANLPCTNPVDDIAQTFDKWRCHTMLDESPTPRPPTHLFDRDQSRNVHTLHDLLDAASLGDRIFLKPRYGSSGSGVCAIRRTGKRIQMIAPIELNMTNTGTTLYNSLRVKAFHEPADQELVLSRLMRDSYIAEQWIRKAKVDGQGFDLRVVVINGEARHTVARASTHPMTNLHLGSSRADMAAVEAAVSTDALTRARSAAEIAAQALPNSLVIGVDILLDHTFEPYVLEMNAFGDLLPGITHRGESTYDAAVSAMVGRMGSRDA